MAVQNDVHPSVQLDRLAVQARHPLLEVSGVFPFDFFPDSIVVDSNKVDIIVREFPFIKRVYSNPLKNINNVTLTTGLFFATITLEVSGYETNPPIIKWLPISEAAQFRRVLTGLILAAKEGVDVSQVSPQEVLAKTEKIGSAREFQA